MTLSDHDRQWRDLETAPPQPKKAPPRWSLWVLVFGALLAYWVLAWLVEYRGVAPTEPTFWEGRIRAFPLLGTFTPIVMIASELLSLSVLRHLLPIIIGGTFAYIITISLVEELYELPDRATAESLTKRLLRGRSGERVTVRRAKLLMERKENPILRWGGPGKVTIGESDAAVTELDGRFYQVLGPGTHDLRRFEYVRSVLDLREQERRRDDVTLTTKEGITVTTSVTVRFRISRGDAVPTPVEPFPFSAKSVRLAAYSETIMDDHSVQTWDALPLAYAIGHLRRAVADLRLDELIDPTHRNNIDPHPTIRTDTLRHARSRLRTHGIELNDAQLGAFQLPDNIHATFLEYWQTFHKRPSPAYAQTEEEIQQEMALQRRKVREQMINALSEGMANVEVPRVLDSRQRDVTLERLIDVLEHLRDDYQSSIVIPRHVVPLITRSQRGALSGDSAESLPLPPDEQPDE